MWAILAGAVLMIGGLLYLFQRPLSRRSSEPRQSAHGGETLEPQRQGLRFLGLSRNWLALLVIVAGALLLLFGAYL
jgi:hypothetical protein